MRASLLEAAALLVGREGAAGVGAAAVGGSTSAAQVKRYAAAAASVSGSAADVATASALLSGSRFGEMWARTVATGHIERLCAMLDDVLLAVSPSSLSSSPAGLPALPAGAEAEAVRLAAIAMSPSYAERRLREARRCAREAERFPESALGAWAAGRMAQTGRISKGGRAEPAAAGAAEADPAIVPVDVLMRRGNAGAEGLLLLTKWATGSVSTSSTGDSGGVRRSLAALLCCCSGSERDGLRVVASFPETSGGLYPLAAPLLHRAVPERAFAAALLDCLQSHRLPYVSGRGAALSPALLRALERSRPLVGVALGSRELLGLDSLLLAEQEQAGGGDDKGASGGSVRGGSAAHLAPFNPSSDAAVAAALQLLELKPEDTLLDVGCGDGRVLVAACLASGCSCVGVETDPALVARAASRAEAAGVADRVRVLHADATATALADLGATAVFLYLVPQGLSIVWPVVKPLLGSAGGQARAVTYVFRAPGGEGVASEVRLGPVSCFLYT